MKLLLGLTTSLLVAVVALSMVRQRSSASHVDTTIEKSRLSRNGDGGAEQQHVFNAETGDVNNQREQTNGRRAFLSVATNTNTSYAGAKDDDGDGYIGASAGQMKGRAPSTPASPHAGMPQDEQIAAVLHVLLDNMMDGVDARPASMMVVTAGQLMDGQDECESSLGRHVLTKAYKNKVDYCNVQGYCTVRYLLERWPAPSIYSDATNIVSPAQLLLPLMHSHPAVEWLLWMPPLSLFTNLSSSFPLRSYLALGKHLILLPTSSPSTIPTPVSLEAMVQNWASFDPLIFLVQNSHWSRDFLAEWETTLRTSLEALIPSTTTKLQKKQGILQNVQADNHLQNNEELDYQVILKDMVTKSLFQVLKSRARKLNFDEVQSKLYVESGLYLHELNQGFLVKSYENLNSFQTANLMQDGIHASRNKKDLRKKNTENRTIDSSKISFLWPSMVHFEGCNLCNAHSQHDGDELCLSTFQRAFHYGDNQLLALANMQHHHLYSSFVF
ncbi:hypothetical protein L7F22_033266 [Adiantum nelumboides]|nr:hypothetical protein [Adiantum nelumboides]